MRRTLTVVALASSVLLGGCDGRSMFAWVQSVWPGAKKGATEIQLPPVTGSNTFRGTVQAEWLHPPTPADYFRDMKLLAPFGFVDSAGKTWDVPAGYVTNGASVPWGLWNIVGGPYDGPYRDAAVVHDYFCETKTRPWEEVHKMFYEAAKARGTSESLASTMYAALRFGGPRWEVKTPVAENTKDPAAALTASATVPANDPGLTRGTATKSQQQQFQDLQSWIEREKPSLAEIERKVEELRRNNGMRTVPTR